MPAVVRVEFKDIFPEEEAQDILYYLNGIDKQMLLSSMVFVASLNNEDEEWRNWRVLIREKWFHRDNIDFFQKVWKALETFEKKIREDSLSIFIILDPLAALKLFEIIFSQQDNQENKVTNLELEQNLFKAHLIINQELNKNDDLMANSLEGISEELIIPALYTTQSMPQFEVTNIDIEKLYYIFTSQLVKSVFLFKFIESTNPQLTEAFFKKFQCSNYKEFYQFFLPLSLSIFNTIKLRKKRGIVTISIKKDDNFEKSCKFIEQFTTNSDSNLIDIDFRYIRKNPLYKKQEGEYVVIFDLFFIQKLYNGLYFEFEAVNKNLNNQTRIKEFRSYFTDNFAEKYLLYEILEKIYSRKSYKRFTGRQIEKEFNFQGGPDYYIRNGNTIFLFENKDIFINSTTKQSYNFLQIQEELRKKLNTDKGIKQITKNIKYILKNFYPFDKYYKSSQVKIYPILVVHRDEFDTPGLNNLINNWFLSELIKLENEGFNIRAISPLTLINIDIFLIYNEAFRLGKIKLEECIDGYVKICKPKFKNGISNTDYSEIIEKSICSFSFFMRSYTRSKGIDIRTQISNWTRKYIKAQL